MTIGPAATGLSSDGAGVAARCIAMANVGAYRVVDAVYRNGLSLPTHTHPQPELSFVTRGSFRETTRRGEAVCTTGMLHVRPSEEPHSNQFDVSGSRITIIDLPLAPTVADRRTRRLLGRSAVIRDGRVASLAGQLQWELHHRDQASDLAIESLVLAMLAQLIRATSGVSTAADRQAPDARLERSREFIDAHFTHALQLADLAVVAGFHPTSFARAFKRRYGMTPWQYQRRRQIEWVREELGRTDRSIAAIAHEAGFADHSHLARAFQTAEGKPPSAVRQSRRG